MTRKPFDENTFIVESRQVKNVVRVTAIDPVSGVEATIITPLRVSQKQREQLAARKLKFVLEKHKNPPAENNTQNEIKQQDDTQDIII